MSPTLAQITVSFLDLYQQTKSTQKSYLSVLHSLLEHYGSKPIDELTLQDLECYLESLQRLATSTYRRHRTIISTLFNYAVREGYLLYNPLTHIANSYPQQSESETTIRYLTPEQLQTLYQVLHQQSTPEGCRIHAFIRLLHRTGAKVSEILALNLDNIDFEQRQFQVTNPHQKTRWCFYSDDVDAVLNQYISKHRYTYCSALFTHEVSRLNYATLYRDWKKLTEHYQDLQFCHLNHLRHTFAIERVGLMPIEVLRELMGHKDIKMTLRYQEFSQTDNCFINQNQLLF